MMLLLEKLRHAFATHPPLDQQTAKRHEAIRKAAETFAAIICVNTPECVEREESFKRIREAMFWANSAVNCYPNGVFGSLPEAALDDKSWQDAARTIASVLGEHRVESEVPNHVP